jgi:hypothetical protein
MWRRAALLVAILPGCSPANLAATWSCDYDASESRPLSDRDATPDPDGELPASVCENTCGPPASRCTAILLDGGLPGAVCPVCTF